MDSRIHSNAPLVTAWLAQDYWQLMGARVLLAFAAGLCAPGANALASALVAPERRRSAIAIVNGGLSPAFALGVPMGGWPWWGGVSPIGPSTLRTRLRWWACPASKQRPSCYR